MKIVVDAMGGDRAPAVPVAGAVLAAKEIGCDIILVGCEKTIKGVLDKCGGPFGKIEIVNASETIRMDEQAAISVRKKRDSSIVRAVEILKNKEADALVSAGNTGAVVCAATLSLRLLPGVDRPGIAVVFPTLTKPCLVIDVGANIDPKPLHLLQYGIMGDACSRHVLNKERPTVALLNIGEESTKGTDFVKEAHILLSESKLNFIGNIEPKEVYEGGADVVVCDGFIGNVFLKVTEGFADAASELLKRELKASNWMTKFGAILTLPTFKSIKKRVDATEYGGAPLMGVDGRVIIAHGSANDVAIKNAIKVSAEYVNHHVNAHIIEELENY
ncbi:MAG: phosphate acyltransferase PlsX [Candidatus Omnitrophica bacterium]|nr:phosphate acyltransferase PlsX [Candidatus Omnitrophota bacterium]MBU1128964.1 phosphate acyltransferase PlsX [Candidatus Omnitrophota bacterium]MBU1784687.1 phosphate acyltransferase PlsX [Candidatus Omnitrophota bacterium]MBU1850937.1 phosphate acyltransferase PlsX [Candidatus Omnitrophota bacterium]